MDISKLLHTLKYVSPLQLRARFFLLLKRKIKETNSAYLNKKFKEKNINLTIQEKLLEQVFPSRKGFFKEYHIDNKKFSLTFLNETHHFQLPVNWHKKEWEHGTRLWKLHLHYMEFLEEVDDDWFTDLIENWIESNLPFKKGYWLDSWNSFALSIRIVVWMQQIAARKENIPKHFIQKAAVSIYKQTLFLEQNIENDIKGNHIIKNIKALLWASSFFKKDNNVKRWERRGHRLLKRELEEQILEDGMHFERSPAYHCQVLADFLDIYSILERSKLKQDLRAKLGKMGEALEMLTHPDGKNSLFNDGGFDMAYPPETLLNKLSALVGYKKTNPVKIILPNSGYWGLQKGDSYFLFDAGKIGPDYLPGHGHGDIFSFEWTIKGMRFFIDKGVYEYDAGEKRDESRATSSHNTVTIAGKDQCEFWQSFRVARRARITVKEQVLSNDRLFIKAFHDGYQRLPGQPIHQRAIDFDGYKLLIDDVITGGNNQKASAYFLLHPQVKLESINKGFTLTRKGVTLEFITNSVTEIHNSTWYPNFGQALLCKQLVVQYGTAPCKGNIKIAKK